MVLLLLSWTGWYTSTHTLTRLCVGTAVRMIWCTVLSPIRAFGGCDHDLYCTCRGKCLTSKHEPRERGNLDKGFRCLVLLVLVTQVNLYYSRCLSPGPI